MTSKPLGPKELPIRSDKADLAALPDGVLSPTDDAFKVVLDTTAQKGAWRLLEAFSNADLPFELKLEWSSGNTFGAHTRITVPAAARVCVYAAHLRVRAANLTNTPHTIAVSVGDTFAETRNFYEWRGRCDGLTAAQVAVPPFALTATVHVDSQALLADTDISVMDGFLTCRAQLRALGLPHGGIPLGAARRIDVLSSGAANLRALFALSL